jgi:hypothetical protein
LLLVFVVDVFTLICVGLRSPALPALMLVTLELTLVGCLSAEVWARFNYWLASECRPYSGFVRV